MTGASSLELLPEVAAEMIAHCLDGLPEEACGLLAGSVVAGPAGPAGAAGDAPGGTVARASRCYPTRNVAASARVYEVDPLQHLRADRDAEANGLVILGVFHSHTHTDAYPSPTDVARAPDPEWHYVIVSLRHGMPSSRSYRISDGRVLEEPLAVRATPGRMPT